MKSCTIALFGEAEKGDFHVGYLCQSVTQLEHIFGNPPPDSKGLFCAIQALLFQHKLLFFRVKEEGFSLPDYLIGFKTLRESALINTISAIAVPGVGDSEVIEAVTPILRTYNQILIANEADLYDFLMGG